MLRLKVQEYEAPPDRIQLVKDTLNQKTEYPIMERLGFIIGQIIKTLREAEVILAIGSSDGSVC